MRPMFETVPGPSAGTSEVVTFDFRALVTAMGDADFASKVLAWFQRICPAESCEIFEFRTNELSLVASSGCQAGHSRTASPSTMYELKSQISRLSSFGAKVDRQRLETPVGNSQKLTISARHGCAVYSLRVMIPAPAKELTEAETSYIREAAFFLAPILAKHADLINRGPDMTPALRSLEEIENCLVLGAVLSRREAEVCSRIIYGLSSCGIALDLGIGKESVMTYRKRAYNRLGIASQRELLVWYLARWSQRHSAHNLAA